MPRHEEKRALPFTPEQMFSVVADVATYPEFLPWCKAARVYNESPNGFEADLVIGFKMYSERFTSKVTLEHRSAIHVDYVRGPMKYLHNDWRFADDGEGGCVVDFVVDFEFKNLFLEKMIGRLFEEAVHRMVLAFETRAREIYG
jgi:coenzyme Q-binding protein COQ10